MPAPGDALDHDLAHIQDAYRDAVGHNDALRAGDGRGAWAIEHDTACGGCPIQSIGEIALRLGDRVAAEQAAAEAVALLAADLEA